MNLQKKLGIWLLSKCRKKNGAYTNNLFLSIATYLMGGVSGGTSTGSLTKTLSDNFTIANWKDTNVILSQGLQLSDNNGANWADTNVIVSKNLVLTDSDVSNWSEASITPALAIAIIVAETNAENWKEAFSLSLFLADDNGSNWNDSFTTNWLFLDLKDGFGYGLVEYGTGYYGETSWLEGVTTNLSAIAPLTETLSDDNSGNWSDALGIGYGEGVVTEQITFSDAFSLGYSLTIAETLLMSDSVNSASVLSLSIIGEQLVTSDGIEAHYGFVISETLTIVEAVAAGYSFSVTDQIVLVDTVNLLLTLEAGIVETIAISDTTATEYGFEITDQDTSWDDSTQINSGQPEEQLILFDQLPMTDFVIAGYGAATSDSFVIVDIIGSEFGITVVDGGGYGVEGWGIDPYGGSWFWADAVVLSETTGGLTEVLSDLVVMSDSSSLGYGLQVSDNDNFWADNFQFNAGQPVIQLALADQLVLSDSLAIGYGDTLSEQVVITDFLQSGFGLAAREQLILSDAFQGVEVELLGFTETIAFSDSQIVGYGIEITDSSNFWNDLFNFNAGQPGIELNLSDDLVLADALAIGYGLGNNEQLTITDVTTAGYGIGIFDQITISDNVVVAAGVLLAVSDSFPAFSDLLRIGYGLGPSEQLTIIDAASATYGLIISDSLNFWADTFDYSGVGTPLSLTLADQIVLFDSEQVSLNFVVLASDQSALTDLLIPNMVFQVDSADTLALWLDVLQALVEFRVKIGENLNLWNDLLELLQLLSLAVQDREDSNWVEELQAQLVYLLSLTEDASNNWQDSVFAGSAFVLTEILADDAGANWLDQFLTLIGIGIGPLSVRSIQVLLKVITEQPIRVLLRVAVGANTVTISPRVSVGLITTDPSLALPMFSEGLISYDLVDDNGSNWNDSLIPFTPNINFSDAFGDVWRDPVNLFRNIPVFNLEAFETMDLLDSVSGIADVIFLDFRDNLDNWNDESENLAEGILLTDSISLDDNSQLELLLIEELIEDGSINWLDVLDSSIETELLTEDLVDNDDNWDDSIVTYSDHVNLADGDINWADSIAINVGNVSIQFTEVLAVIQDKVRIDWTNILSDSLALSDALTATPNFVLVFADSDGGNWNDANNTEKGSSLAFIDNINLNDALLVGLTIILRDSNSGNWNDAVSKQQSAISISDDASANWLDAARVDSGVILGDNDSSWLDLVNKTLANSGSQLILQVTDVESITDSGLRVAKGIVLTDNNGANWDDSGVAPTQDYSIDVEEILTMADLVGTT